MTTKRYAHITIRCNEDEREEWHKVADKRGVTLSELVKEWLRSLQERDEEKAKSS